MIQTMIATTTTTKLEAPESHEARYTCFSCGEPATIEELLLVDHLIENSPCFKDVSENFSHCIGEDLVFHGSIVNCDAACYAAIIETVAPCEETTRVAEIANLVRTLRAVSSHPEARTVFDIPAKTTITLERLLASLIDVGRIPAISLDDLAEALYCKSSALYALLG